MLADDRRASTTNACAHLRRDGLGRLAHSQPFLSDETRAVNPAWAQNQVHDVPPPESAPHSVPASTSLWGTGGVELGVTTCVNTNPEESASTCCVHVALISSLTRMNRGLWLLFCPPLAL
ncbi:hypothetical protein [Streptomyces sp. NPDC059604]|uniref:hypothetical protein n=1 Tax=Streptomyces sp. NPDC059604 TaxID=3346881 RepID=UPI00368D9D25